MSGLETVLYGIGKPDSKFSERDVRIEELAPRQMDAVMGIYHQYRAYRRAMERGDGSWVEVMALDLKDWKW